MQTLNSAVTSWMTLSFTFEKRGKIQKNPVPLRIPTFLTPKSQRNFELKDDVNVDVGESQSLQCHSGDVMISDKYKGLVGKNDPLTIFLVSQNLGGIPK